MNNEIEFLEEEKFFNTKAFWIAVGIGVIIGLTLAILTAPWWATWIINYLAK